MLFEKCQIYTSQYEHTVSVQVTLDDDFNIPDAKPDMDKVIREEGHIQLQQIRVQQDKVQLRGIMSFEVLYLCRQSGHAVSAFSGEIPFDELVNMEGITEEADIDVERDIEDLRIGMINSRKISVRALMTMTVSGQCRREIEAVTSPVESENVCTQMQTCMVSQPKLRKKDTFRVREEVQLPSSKANIIALLWDDIQMNNVETKVMEDRIQIRGDVTVFVLYDGEQEESIFESAELEVPWHAEVECAGIREDMIADIRFYSMSKTTEVRPDKDGEMRVLAIDAAMEMNIDAYQDTQIHILKDIYATDRQLFPATAAVRVPHLLTHNESKCRLTEHIPLRPAQNGVLQLCHADGTARLDHVEMNGGGLLAEGVLAVRILCVLGDDDQPLDVIRQMIPFSYLIEVNQIHEGCIYQVHPSVQQMSIMMSDSADVEVKAVVGLDAMVFDHQRMSVVTDVNEAPLDYSVMEGLPGVVGYIVRDGDSLWQLAKKYYTTESRLMEINMLPTPEIKQGDHIMIVKNISV